MQKDRSKDKQDSEKLKRRDEPEVRVYSRHGLLVLFQSEILGRNFVAHV